jgi:diphthine-ammonia ligase
MKLAALFSGGKDSAYAIYKVMQMNKERSKPAKPASFQVACLISMISENPESYMFHTPNISLVRMQAEAMGLPLIKASTKGEKEKELRDLETAILQAKKQYGIGGVVTGAVASKYQADRIQKICGKLGLECINPLWERDQLSLLRELLAAGFHVIISGVFAYPLDKSWLGKEITKDTIKDLAKLQDKYGISPMGEGGEIETTVLDCPLFKKRIRILDSEKAWQGDSGIFRIKRAELEGK